MAEHTVITRDRHLMRSGREIDHIKIVFEADGDETCSEDIAAKMGDDILCGFLCAITAIGGDISWDLDLHTPDDFDILGTNMKTMPIAGELYVPTTPIPMVTEMTLEIVGAGAAGTGTVELFVEI